MCVSYNKKTSFALSIIFLLLCTHTHTHAMDKLCVVSYLVSTIKKRYESESLTINVLSQPLKQFKTTVFKWPNIISGIASEPVSETYYYSQTFDLGNYSINTRDTEREGKEVFQEIVERFSDMAKNIFEQQIEIHKDKNRCFIFIDCDINFHDYLIIFHPTLQTLFC